MANYTKKFNNLQPVNHKKILLKLKIYQDQGIIFNLKKLFKKKITIKYTKKFYKIKIF